MNKKITIPAYDNTLKIKELSHAMDDFTWYVIPAGHESQPYKIGDMIITNSKDIFKPGLEFKIEKIQNNDNGYWNYYYGGAWHKQEGFIKKV